MAFIPIFKKAISIVSVVGTVVRLLRNEAVSTFLWFTNL